MKEAKSWICYLWLLTIEAFEELFDFVSIHNPISKREMRLSDDGRFNRSDSQLSDSAGGRERRTIGFYG
jgi:hypothetical protein